jgi:hypothetical protein
MLAFNRPLLKSIICMQPSEKSTADFLTMAYVPDSEYLTCVFCRHRSELEDLEKSIGKWAHSRVGTPGASIPGMYMCTYVCVYVHGVCMCVCTSVKMLWYVSM